MKNLIFKINFKISLFAIIFFSCENSKEKIQPIQPLPNTYQLEWQQLEYYAFIHFNMNTFTNKEWGYGDEKPELFNPTMLNTRQWARVVKESGMKGIIITAKHHDGFCLWPSSYTEHSVKNSPWKSGEGDLIKELSDACKGIWIKIWNISFPMGPKSSKLRGTKISHIFQKSIERALTNYGDIFEVWFDGANGGDGFYGGAYEDRRVDKKTYYDWTKTIKIIRKLQPHAVIFSDAGPDIRWVGNEKGYANETTWSPIYKLVDIYYNSL